MAIPYEKIVKQDLQLGFGQVSVTMPAGGSSIGDKIGLHTFAHVYNVRDFGAAGDGQTDDTLALQAAIDQAGIDGDGLGCVFVPPGEYRITGTLLYQGNDLALVGVGANSSVITHDPAAASTDAVVFQSPNENYQSDNSVRGITIQSTSGRSRYLLDINGQEGFLLDHAYVTGGVHAVRINNAIHGRLAFSKIRDASSHGLRVGDTGVSWTTISVVGCYISSNGGAGVYSEGGTGMVFHGGIFESNGTFGLHVPTGSARVFSCHFEGNTSGCVRGGDTFPGNVYTYLQTIGNSFIGGSQPIFTVDYAVVTSVGDYAVTNNIFVSSTTNTKRLQLLSDPIPPSAVTLEPLVQTDAGVVRGSLGAPAEGLIALGNSGSHYQPNVRDAGTQTLTLNANFTMNAVVGEAVIGQALTFQFVQDATGGRTVTWDSSFVHAWSNNGNVANARASITFVFDGTYWVQRAYIPWNTGTWPFPRIDVAGLQTLVSDLKLTDASPTLYLTSTTGTTGKEWAIFTLGASGIFRIDDDTTNHNEFYIDPANGLAMIRQPLRIQNTTAALYAGTGSPAGVLSAPVGSLFLRTDGGASTVLYVKESGGNGNTGWVAK